MSTPMSALGVRPLSVVDDILSHGDRLTPYKKQRSHSPVWDCFTELTTTKMVYDHRVTNRVTDVEKTVCKCNYCDYIHPHPMFKHLELSTAHYNSCTSRMTNKKSRQPSAQDSFPSAMTAAEQQDAQQTLADWFYETGTPFFRVEHPKLKKLLTSLRGDIKLPTRQALAGKFLDNAYESIVKKVNQELSTSIGVCLTSDGWSNVNNEPVINYCGVTVDQAFFLECNFTKTQGHNADYIYNDIKRVICEHENVTVVGCCTDNTSANKNAWELLRDEYPDKFFYGCVCHALHLLAKDCIEDIPWLATLNANCREVVKIIKKSPLISASIDVMLSDFDLNNFVLSGATRWGSVLKSLKRIKENIGVLTSFVKNDEFVEVDKVTKQKRQLLKDYFKGTSFKGHLDNAILILQPICDQIVAFQNDHRPISDVIVAFESLTSYFLDHPALDQESKNACCEYVGDRYDFIYSSCHGFAYMIDPKYDCKMLQQDEIVANLTLLNSYCDNDSVSTEYLLYRVFLEEISTQGHALHHFYSLCESREKSPLQFWKAISQIGRFPILNKLAQTLFCLTPSSAASERNFSTFGFIHNKLRNRLNNDKVEKLVYIFGNSKPFASADDEDLLATVVIDE